MTPKTHQEQPMSDSGVIRVRGARTNNLRNVDVNIAKKQLTVVTGSRDRDDAPPGVGGVEHCRRDTDCIPFFSWVRPRCENEDVVLTCEALHRRWTSCLDCDDAR